MDGDRVDVVDFENDALKQLKSNVYLARVTRVELRYRRHLLTMVETDTASCPSVKSIQITIKSQLKIVKN